MLAGERHTATAAHSSKWNLYRERFSANIEMTDYKTAIFTVGRIQCWVLTRSGTANAAVMVARRRGASGRIAAPSGITDAVSSAIVNVSAAS